MRAQSSLTRSEAIRDRLDAAALGVQNISSLSVTQTDRQVGRQIKRWLSPPKNLMTVTFVARLEYHSQLLIWQFSPVGIPILFETGKNCLKELDSLVDELLSKRSVRLSVTPRILFKNFSYDEQRYDRNIPMISCDIHVCPFTIELWQAILGFLWSPEWLLFSHAIFRHQAFFWMTLRFCFHEGFGFAFQHEITRTSIKNIMDNAQYCVSRDERQSNNLSFGTRPFTLRNGWIGCPKMHQSCRIS